MLAGGEPLLSHGWLEALASHPELLGIVFTNGTLFDDFHLAWFSKYRHIFPVFSLEGGEKTTDFRRGQGVYRQVNGAMTGLKKAGVPFGVSVTATNENLEEILSIGFIEEYISKGCCLFIYPEYVPVETGSEPLVLSKEQKQRLLDFAQKSAKEYPALLIPFPGDEEQYGGCLAAGRGFIHISSSGAVEPCPFAPFSDSSLQTSSLAQSLDSKLLSKVRAYHQLLKEVEGGCALWRNRAWFLSAEEDTLTAVTL
jgi:MoaA/NifB/PqqE/SkfB family radical SAM enzyme